MAEYKYVLYKKFPDVELYRIVFKENIEIVDDKMDENIKSVERYSALVDNWLWTKPEFNKKKGFLTIISKDKAILEKQYLKGTA